MPMVSQSYNHSRPIALRMRKEDESEHMKKQKSKSLRRPSCWKLIWDKDKVDCQSTVLYTVAASGRPICWQASSSRRERLCLASKRSHPKCIQ